MNRFTQLYQQRKAQSTTEFVGRGARRARCPVCQVRQDACICASAKLQPSGCGFALVMHTKEVLRPSNTGRFIADIVADTHAFIWSRQEADQALLALLNDPQWQPYLVFPAHFAEPERVTETLLHSAEKKPLFVMLDGSWREARKMFHQSPWLSSLPVLALRPDQASSYGLRSSPLKEQWATAEVAARLLAMNGDTLAAQGLQQRFEDFTQATLAGRCH